MKLFDAQGLPKGGRAGPAGGNGTSGADGPMGPAVFLQAEDGEDGWHAIPGKDGAPGTAGTPGAAGAAGPPGPAGPAIYLMADDGEDGMMGPPGVAGATTAGAAANITPDTHPGSRTNWDDEFEVGSSLDTAGTRFSGANAWTVKNAHSTTNVVANGALQISVSGGGVNDDTVYLQSTSGVGGTWAFTTKRLSPDSATFLGLFVGFAASGQGYYFGTLTNSGTPSTFVISQSTYAGSGVSVVSSTTGATLNQLSCTYLRIAFDGTNLLFQMSLDGINFFTLFSVLPATFLGGAPDSIGLMAGAAAVGANYNISGAFDWFRKTA